MWALAGRRVPEDLAQELGVTAATLYRWKKQALIDAGRRPGIKSSEPDELDRARRRIKDLEDELELVKAAQCLVQRRRGGPSKRLGPVVTGFLVATDLGGDGFEALAQVVDLDDEAATSCAPPGCRCVVPRRWPAVRGAGRGWPWPSRPVRRRR
jgi:transposase-like protein